MRVRVIFHGILSDWLGTKEAYLELPQGASLKDLTQMLRGRFSHVMPQQLWDPSNNTFAKQVLAVRGAEPLRDLDTTLEEGQEIGFFLLLAGG